MKKIKTMALISLAFSIKLFALELDPKYVDARKIFETANTSFTEFKGGHYKCTSIMYEGTANTNIFIIEKHYNGKFILPSGDETPAEFAIQTNMGLTAIAKNYYLGAFDVVLRHYDENKLIIENSALITNPTSAIWNSHQSKDLRSIAMPKDHAVFVYYMCERA